MRKEVKEQRKNDKYQAPGGGSDGDFGQTLSFSPSYVYTQRNDEKAVGVFIRIAPGINKISPDREVGEDEACEKKRW